MENPPTPENHKETKPALTIHVYSWATPILGLIMLIIGLVAGFLGRPLINQTAITPTANPGASATDNSPTSDRQPELKSLIIEQTRHFIGDDAAPITIIEFSDFQCPYCSRYFVNVWPQINEQYIKTGKVRFGYMHFAFLSQESFWAAEASECAGDQGKFWEYHDVLFASQVGENRVDLNKDNLKEFAADLNLDRKRFDACLDEGKYTSLIQQQTRFLQTLGVSSTPSFIINNQPLIGAQPFEAFQQVIEAELKSEP